MAGIEKICEFSDEYIGPDMYAYKRNHIQIHPRYRKHFRGASHTLYISSVKPYWALKGGGITEFDKRDMDNYEPPFGSVFEYIDYIRYFNGWRLVKQVEFNLKVDDPELAGNVDGNYREWTTDFTSLKRRLKRMLRCKDLNIVDLTDSKKLALVKDGVDRVLAHESRSEQEAEAQAYADELIKPIQKLISDRADLETVAQALRDGNIRWMVFSNHLRNSDSRIFVLEDNHFRNRVIEVLPDQARMMDWIKE